MFKDLKSLFEKRGFIINWKGLETQNLNETINALAMASPFSIEEKQKLIEANQTEEKFKVLNKIIEFNLFDFFQNKTIQ
mgnify:CR=1 FL=1